MRLSGCPSLSVKHTDDPLKDDPVAHVLDSCVGCGNCGEVAEAACCARRSYRADIINNPRPWDRVLARVRSAVIGLLQRRPGAAPAGAGLTMDAPTLTAAGRRISIPADRSRSPCWRSAPRRRRADGLDRRPRGEPRLLTQATSVPGVAQRIRRDHLLCRDHRRRWLGPAARSCP